MHATILPAGERAPANLAVGYTKLGNDGQLHPGQRRAFNAVQPGKATAAGGGYTTASDLLRSARALRRHQLLSAEALEEVWQPRIAGERPGYGFPGVAAQFDICPKSGYTIIVLANYELVREAVSNKLAELLHP